MENYDFQVNDKVFDLMFGNGAIGNECNNKRGMTIEVKFDKANPDVSFWYNKDGTFESCSGLQTDFEVQGEINIINRTLFHGHDIVKKLRSDEDSNWEFTVREQKPVRYPWVNVFIPNCKSSNKEYTAHAFIGKKYNTKTEAMAGSINEYQNVSWINAIQLKPDDPECDTYHIK